MTAREVLARIIRGLVKVVTCAAGGAIAGVVIMLVFSSGLNPIFYESDWAGVVGSCLVIGTYIGVCWSIEHAKAKNAFMGWTLIPLIIAVVAGVATGSGEVFAAIVIVGWFIGIVRAISYTGVFRSK